MLVTKLIEGMKYNQGIFFLLEIESIIKRIIRSKIKIHRGKIKLPLKRRKSECCSKFFNEFSKYCVHFFKSLKLKNGNEKLRKYHQKKICLIYR